MTKAEWVAALRSGKYKQDFGRLKGENGFCCLGVACDVKDPEAWMFVPNTVARNWWHDSGYNLPEEFRKELGLTADQAGTLVLLNDTDKLTFNQIADWIEANVQG